MRNKIKALAAKAAGMRVRAEFVPISSEELLKALGVYTGLTKLYVAFMTKAETSTALPEYETAQVASELVEIGITPEYTTGQLNASDNSIRDSSVVAKYTVRINSPRLVPAMRKKMLGRLTTGDGLEVIGDNTEGPDLAIGYAANRDDGTQQMRWLLKGHFKEITITDKTKERGTIAYQVPVLEGTFTPIDTDCVIGGKKTKPIMVEGDTSTGGTTMKAADFFKNVQLPELATEAQ